MVPDTLQERAASHTPLIRIAAAAPNPGYASTTNATCIVASPKGASIWNSHATGSNELGFQNRSTVGIYVKDSLFPNIKFLSDDMIGFNTEDQSFCQHVLGDMAVPKDLARRWWEQNEVLVFEAMRRRRNECHTSMKVAFNGMLLQNWYVHMFVVASNPFPLFFV